MTLWDALTGLLDCAETALGETAAGVPDRVFVNPGGPAPWDNCCDLGGQLWVRVISSAPSGDNTGPCPYLVTRVGLGVVRCAHSVDDRGRPPTVEQVTADASTMVCDMSALFSALCGCDDGWRVESWSPLGAQGGCVGGEWTLRTDAALKCPDTSPGESP